MKFDYCQKVLINNTYKCNDYKYSHCDGCNIVKAYEYGVWKSRMKTLNDIVKFICEKVPLSTFMKRGVTDADKSCLELCDKIQTNIPSEWEEEYRNRMLTLNKNVKAILDGHFTETKDEIKEDALKRILEIIKSTN